jgi:hypothetical protein
LRSTQSGAFCSYFGARLGAHRSARSTPVRPLTDPGETVTDSAA